MLDLICYFSYVVIKKPVHYLKDNLCAWLRARPSSRFCTKIADIVEFFVRDETIMLMVNSLIPEIHSLISQIQ